MNTSKRALVIAGLLAAMHASTAAAQEKPDVDGQKVLDKAMAYLATTQRPDGSFKLDDREPPALTAMVLRAMALEPQIGAKAPAAQKAIAYLLATQKPDGGIYTDMLANYNTALAISGLTAVKDPKLEEPIKKAVAYLKSSQAGDATPADRGEKVDPKSPSFGGWNYGGVGRRAGQPDLSNTAVALDALNDAGLAKDDPAYQNALKFVSRLQNNSESNPAAWASNDGGFIYNPGKDGGGDSPAGTYEEAGKRRNRSYGSMTYAGLKSMIYAGLSKDDPRVKSAVEWIRNNWTVEEHPGMGLSDPANAQAGVFYYYEVLARSMAAYGETTITDKAGVAHDWRVELISKLAALQKPNGSFAGTSKWMEQDPLIATSLATFALQEAVQDLKAHPAKK